MCLVGFPLCASPLQEDTHFIQAGNKPTIKCQSSSNSSREMFSTKLFRFFKLPFLAQVESAKGIDVAGLNCTGGRQILLSNRVLERAVFGEEPRELCLGALTASLDSGRGKR